MVKHSHVPISQIRDPILAACRPETKDIAYQRPARAPLRSGITLGSDSLQPARRGGERRTRSSEMQSYLTISGCHSERLINKSRPVTTVSARNLHLTPRTQKGAQARMRGGSRACAPWERNQLRRLNRRARSSPSGFLSGCVSRTTPRPGIVVPRRSISTMRPRAPPRALIAQLPTFGTITGA